MCDCILSCKQYIEQGIQSYLFLQKCTCLFQQQLLSESPAIWLVYPEEQKQRISPIFIQAFVIHVILYKHQYIIFALNICYRSNLISG